MILISIFVRQLTQTKTQQHEPSTISYSLDQL
jgi:hypothetical protein